VDGEPSSRYSCGGGRKLSGCAASGEDCANCNRSHVKCQFCGQVVIPRVGAYWFLLLAQRGRCRRRDVADLQIVLCSGCGRRLRELLEANGYDPAGIAQAMTGNPE
jgi:hypothetical protein